MKYKYDSFEIVSGVEGRVGTRDHVVQNEFCVHKAAVLQSSYIDVS